jgi:Glycosyl transferase family 2
MRRIQFKNSFRLFPVFKTAIFVIAFLLLWINFSIYPQSFVSQKNDTIDKTFKQGSTQLDDGLTDEQKQFIEKLGLTNPGMDGIGVELPNNLTEDIQKLVQEGYDTDFFNSFVSNMISLNRMLSDVRSEECKAKVYSNLPKCTILISFSNENWKTLLRTVHSVINNSPLDLIEEILMVDDASTKGKCFD